MPEHDAGRTGDEDDELDLSIPRYDPSEPWWFRPYPRFIMFVTGLCVLLALVTRALSWLAVGA
jgi:hypothetical protein